MVYDPAAVPAGSANAREALPNASVPLVTGLPTCTLPAANTVNVTVPSLTPAAPLVTDALSVTDCAPALNWAAAAVATVVVAAWLTASVCVESELVNKPGPGL